MLSNLPENLIVELKELTSKIFSFAIHEHPKIQSIVIQYNNEDITIGKNQAGSYKPIYYDPNYRKTGDEPYEIILEHYSDTINKTFNLIIDSHPRICSFNIYYNRKEIYVCRNTIGAISFYKALLFAPITIN